MPLQFGGTVLSTVFEEQSAKWESLSLGHVSELILLVHHYVFRLLCHLCPEKPIRDQIWDGYLVEELTGRYRKAMDHARFLLKIERGRPATFNHYFNDVLQKRRATRQANSMEKLAFKMNTTDGTPGPFVSLAQLKIAAENKSNDEQLQEDVLDAFVSYYKVARKRFVDNLFQQVISYFLLNSEESPVRAFGPEMIMRLGGDELDLIAGEDEESRQKRLALNREIESLSLALKVLRS